MTRLLGRAGTIVAVTLAAMGAALLWFPAGATDEAFVQGSGAASSSVLRIGPSAGRLSLAPQVGVALADYTGTVGRGESRIFDYAALDDSVPAQFKDQFPSVRVTSTDEGASKGDERTIAGSGSGSVAAGASVQRASATNEPIGRSSYRLGSLSVPGMIEVRGAEAASSAGIVAEDATRQAQGVTTIDSLTLGGGAVVLSGLRWDATQRTGDGATVSAGFTVGSVLINGQAAALPASGALAPLAGPINAALSPTGLVLDLPQASTANGVAQVSPLAVRIVDSAIGRQLLAPVLAGTQPARDPVAQFIFTYMDEASGAVLVGDVGVGVASGAGRLDLEIGGASAYTEGQRFDSPFDFDFGAGGGDGSFGGFGSGDGDAGSGSFGFVDGGSGVATADGVGGSPSVPTAADDGAAGVAARAVATKTIGGKRGGAAAAVGGLGLLTALGVAIADYRAMRGARRIVPTA